MPSTAKGLPYPDSGGHTRLWEHLQALAQAVDTALSTYGSPAYPRAQGVITTSHSAASGWSRLTSLTELYDQQPGSGGLNPSTGLYVVPQTGLYAVAAAVTFDNASATGRRMLALEKGTGNPGTNNPHLTRAESSAYSGGYPALNVYREVQLTAGETVSVALYQGSGGALNVRGDFSASTFAIRRIA